MKTKTDPEVASLDGDAVYYELLLRGPKPVALEDAESTIASVAGRSQVRVSAMCEGDLSGLDLSVTVEDTALGTVLFDAAHQLAASHELSIYDPQLGRVITNAQGDREDLQACFGRNVAFRANRRIGGASPTAASTRTPTALLWWAVAAFAAVIVLAGRALRCAL